MIDLRNNTKYLFFLFIISSINNIVLCQLNITYSGLDSLICYNHNNGSILLTVTGGTPPYQYLWDNGNMTNKRDSLAKGRYICTISDNSVPKNNVIDTFTIYAPNDPIIHFHPLKWDCNTFIPFVRVDSFSNFFEPFYGGKNLSADKKDTIWSIVKPIGSDWWAHYSDDHWVYNETFVIKDSRGCKMIDDYIIDTSIRKFVKVGFKTFPFSTDTIIDYGSSIRFGIDLSPYSNPSAVNIQWFDDKGAISCKNCKSLFMKPITTTTYRVEVSNPTYGCISTHEFVVIVKDPPPDKYNEGKCFAPNIFSPDYNGYNDYFLPNFNESILIVKKMQIFNRWGGLVFEKTNFLPNDEKSGWDGRNNGKIAPNGIYLYTIEVEWKNHNNQIYNGDFYLMNDNK